MPKQDFNFDVPVNKGRIPKGMLNLTGTGDGQTIEIDRITFTDTYKRKADVTFLIEEFAYELYCNLVEMAQHHTAVEEADYTLEKQDA
jgi:hypothetical protein